LTATKGEPVLWKRNFDGLEALVAERGNALLATAVLLTGSRAAGEDLLQSALERLMRSWGRVREDREGYLRRVMYNLAVDQWRRRRLVLRYWEQLSEAETATALGISVGSVKSTASRGLSRLRELTAGWDLMSSPIHSAPFANGATR
jgi:DNA-directed RNA polymerase specialized sigma24 family protein